MIHDQILVNSFASETIDEIRTSLDYVISINFLILIITLWPNKAYVTDSFWAYMEKESDRERGNGKGNVINCGNFSDSFCSSFVNKTLQN